MTALIFLIFAGIAVFCGISLVVQTHPIASALSLIGVMGSLAVLYLQLGGEFIAMAQIIVYAGAIMVLFVFVIMLLNAGAEVSTFQASKFVKYLGIVLLAAFLGLISFIIQATLPKTEGVLFGAFQGTAAERRTQTVHQLSAAVRSDLGANPDRTGWRDRAGEKGSLTVPNALLTSPVPLSWYLILSAILFGLGVAGFIFRRNIITVFMSIELMLNAVNLSFVTFSYQFKQVDGHIYSFFVMVVAAAEAAVGLAIILTVFKNRSTLMIDDVNSMKY